METVKLILTIVSATGILSLATAEVIRRIKRERQHDKATEKGIQALLRDRLIYQYDKYKAKGFAPIYAKENFENLYQQYHNLGANGVMDDIYNDFRKLPTRGEYDERTHN
jgi:hypothetical protein